MLAGHGPAANPHGRGARPRQRRGGLAQGLGQASACVGHMRHRLTGQRGDAASFRLVEERHWDRGHVGDCEVVDD
jgi:hypothetical protein